MRPSEMSDDELAGALSAELGSRRKRAYDACAKAATEALVANGVKLKVGWRAKDFFIDFFCNVNGREVVILKAHHNQKVATSTKPYPFWVSSDSDNFKRCGDQKKGLAAATAKLVGDETILRVMREEVANKHVVAYSNGIPVYSHELGMGRKT